MEPIDQSQTLVSALKSANKFSEGKLRLPNGLAIAAYIDDHDRLVLHSDVGIDIITIEKPNSTLIKHLAGALGLTKREMRTKLRDLTEAFKITWKADPFIRTRNAAFAIDCFCSALPPKVAVLMNLKELSDPLPRCLGCNNRYSPVCKYCPKDGTCSRCGIRMYYNDNERDWTCPVCGRTYREDFDETEKH